MIPISVFSFSAPNIIIFFFFGLKWMEKPFQHCPEYSFMSYWVLMLSTEQTRENHRKKKIIRKIKSKQQNKRETKVEKEEMTAMASASATSTTTWKKYYCLHSQFTFMRFKHSWVAVTWMWVVTFFFSVHSQHSFPFVQCERKVHNDDFHGWWPFQLALCDCICVRSLVFLVHVSKCFLLFISFPSFLYTFFSLTSIPCCGKCHVFLSISNACVKYNQ